MLPWDGSDLGSFAKYSVIVTLKSGNFLYWKFGYLGEIYFCMSRQASGKVKASHQCIIDEAKSLFGIPKIGTHRARYQGKRYILMRVPMLPGSKTMIQSEYPIGMIPDLDDCLLKHPEILIRMQHLLAFWDIMGVKASQNCALLRNFGTETAAIWSPVGFKETTINPSDFGHFSQIMLRKWFQDISVPQAVARMMGIANFDQFYEKQIWFSGELQNIVRRIDPTALHLVSGIMERVINRISQALHVRN